MEERTSSYTLVTDVEELVRVAASLKEADFIGLDIETTGLNPRDGGLRLIQLATPEATFVVDAFETGGSHP